MSIAPAIESVLTNGGVLLVDGLERELHPLLVNVVISKFQSKKTNPLGAQIVFTTHDTELLNMELIRKDQLYFVDKNQKMVHLNCIALANLELGQLRIFEKDICLVNMEPPPDVEIEEVE